MRSTLDDHVAEHAGRRMIRKVAMKRPLAQCGDLGFHFDRNAGRHADHMLDRIPFSGTVVEDRPHAVQMHRVNYRPFTVGIKNQDTKFQSIHSNRR